MNWKTILCFGVLAACFTGCFAEDESLSGPSFEDLQEARRAGDLPFDAVLESVTFINAANGQEMTVELTSQNFNFQDCSATWCPVLNPLSDGDTPVYCPPGGGSTPDPDGDPAEGALIFNYDDLGNAVSFDNFQGAANMEAWAERDLFYTVTKVDRGVQLSCTDCPGKYDDFQYTDRVVTLRSQD